MNYNILKEVVKSSKIPRKEIALRSNVTPKTIDNILAGGDPKVSTLEAIANALGVPVNVFFDKYGESVTVLANDHSQAAGRDFHIGISPREAELEKENIDLRQQLIEAQSKIIHLMEKQNN